jgi:hypothetical protein
MKTTPRATVMLLRGIAAATLATAIFVPTLSAQEEPAWEKLLRLQLEDTHKCVMSGTLFVRELPVDDGVVYSGRAKCFDGRDFDFSQSKPHLKFEIKSCDPTVC